MDHQIGTSLKINSHFACFAVIPSITIKLAQIAVDGLTPDHKEDGTVFRRTEMEDE
jgi:hypothetical protein